MFSQADRPLDDDSLMSAIHDGIDQSFRMHNKVHLNIIQGDLNFY